LLVGASILLGASLIPADAQAPRPLRVSDNHRFFVTLDGAPFLYLGDTAWGLFHFTRENVDLYLKDRADKRFTVIQVIVAHWGGLEIPNAYGQTVFVDKDPGRPNEAYFQQVDYVVYIAMVPIWSKEYVNQQQSVLDSSSAAAYGKFLGSRYRQKPVIWILGGDWFADGVEDIWRAMAAGIRAGDGGDHLMTYHPKSPRSSSQWFHNEPWLDFNMLQTGHTTLNRNYELVAADYARTPVKPVVDGEGGYEGIGDYQEKQLKIQAHDVRRIAYCALFAGAAGYAYGAQGLYGYRDSTGGRRGSSAGNRAASLKEAMQLPGATQMQHLRALLESRPMLKLIPDQWLLVKDPMGTTDRMQACRASDGSYAFVYTASGRTLRVRIRDKIYTKLTGELIKAWWYDPRRGTATPIGEYPRAQFKLLDEVEAYGTLGLEFTPPSSGPGIDWVLVLDDAAKNYPPPGRKATQ
jgi:hypothetical protein